MTSEEGLQLLGGRTPAVFLEDYWQKRPLLIRQAIPGLQSPLQPEELAGLACEPGVEARLVRHDPAPPHWELAHGPFRESDFTSLPERDWTLLVQDVDKHVPEMAGLLELFSFLPAWRIDDLMVSYAAEGGGVGPHLDAYDVFLLQADGTRRWEIDPEPADTGCLPDLELKVLENFAPCESWLLRPGDMLYLPPGVAHKGVAEGGGCLTFSIGLRAPSLHEMLVDFLELRLQETPDSLRYADSDLASDEAASGLLSGQARARMRTLLRRGLDPGDAALDRWFGRFITEPKPWLQPEREQQALDGAGLRKALESGALLLRDSASRLAWYPTHSGPVLFANGKAFDLPAKLEPMVRMLCERRHFAPADLAGYLEHGEAVDLLVRLHDTGILEFAVDE